MVSAKRRFSLAFSSSSDLRRWVSETSTLGTSLRDPCRAVHATVFGFELVDRRGTEAMPAAHLSSWHPSFLFFDHPDNLSFGKTALSHLFAP
jgi:hypothetical protein